MVIDRPGAKLRLEERPIPVPAKSEVLIRVRACGVCRTDLHVVDGELPETRYPVVPGHEIVGRSPGSATASRPFGEASGSASLGSVGPAGHVATASPAPRIFAIAPASRAARFAHHADLMM
jgi:hypothetical protein